MGSGTWDTTSYRSAATARVAAKVDDFHYSSTAVDNHPNLDPKRINSKPFGKLESRDNAEHPESNAVYITFDVTGSNIARARIAQQKLPTAMDLLNKYLPDVQVGIGANDDAWYEGDQAIQLSDFESDNRVDEHIRNIRLIGDGGGNNKESYDLLLYAAAYKMVLDCVEKRGKKGYLFLFADEPIPTEVLKDHALMVFGDVIEDNIPIAKIIEDVREQFNIFMIWPQGGFISARDQYIDLFGKESVLILQDPTMICELIASTVGLFEEKISAKDAIDDLVSVGGLSTAAATDIVQSALAVIPKSSTVSTSVATGRLKSLTVTDSGSERL